MYNGKQKEKYLEFERINYANLRGYFERIATKEQEHQKDIYRMNREELVDTFKALNIRREETRRHLISLMRGYVNWARLNEYKNVSNVINSLTPVSISSIETYKDTMIKAPEHLQKILDDGLDRINYENRSKILELIFWLLYQGISLEDMPLLEKVSIDYSNCLISVPNDKTYKVDDKITTMWKDCAKIDYIERRNGRSSVSKRNNVEEYIKYELIDNNYLFRPIIGNKVNGKQKISVSTLRKMISSVFEACDMKSIPMRNINYSGIFYKMFLLEKAGESITPAVISEYFEINYKDHTALVAYTRKWRIDYEDWKIGFNLTL